MRNHKAFQTGLSIFDETSLAEFSHEEMEKMVAGRVLKAMHTDLGLADFPQDEVRAAAERVAKLCMVLALCPQRLEIPEC